MALAAMLTLAIGASAASANRSLEIEGNTTTWRLTQREIEFLSEQGGIRCEITLTKTLSRRIPKIANTRIGRITDVRLANCRGTTGITFQQATVLGIEAGNTTLWLIFYKAFLGTLPNPSGYRFEIEHAQILIRFRDIVAEVACLYEGNVEGLAEVEANGNIGRLKILREARTVTLTMAGLNSMLCPRQGEFLAEELAPGQAVRIILLA